ncbi:MAG: glycine--tRNA ligase subunit beta [Pseudomonadales bacterium]|nr:glycine--tRNA ligase subunit beta [Pseudomonadales bacterium]
MSNEVADLLVELGTEELPPKALKKLSDAFTEGVRAGLISNKLSFAAIQSFATPRRLAIKISGLAIKQENQTVQRKGPSLKAAYDAEGNPSKAALGFAKSCGVEIDQLQTQETKKGTWLVFENNQLGQDTEVLIPAIIEDSLSKLPIPKRMTWGSHRIAFVRPVHWLILLFDDKVITATILGKTASNTSLGHRFHSTGKIVIKSIGEYEETLEKVGRVIADFDKRKAIIKQQVETIAKSLSGVAQIEEDLLNEVTGLVEWPVALAGKFDPSFLEIPQECLISAMKEHQKYFPVLDANGKLLPVFITVSNIESKEPEKVIAGNEKVIRPRLADAAFFFNTDKSQVLEKYNSRLHKLVFQENLGTVFEKTQRISALANSIAKEIGDASTNAKRAGELCKADLVTEMVGEFPDLQGTMGRYYASHCGENSEVAQAIEEQYLPRYAGDSLPQSKPGIALSIADKLDTIVAIFGVGQTPSGSKDPFALRRSALGILRIIIEKDLDLDLKCLINDAATLLGNKITDTDTQQNVFDFINGRFRDWYKQDGIDTDVIIAVANLKPSKPSDFNKRVKAIAQFKENPAAQALSAANKRVSNILKKVVITFDKKINESLLIEDAEKKLANAIDQQGNEASRLFDRNQYNEGLKLLATLRPEVDRFFDEVMVMTDDDDIRDNRLILLNNLRELFLQVADISELSQ